ncbi:MAG: hypothetical protein FWE72_07245 [Spirochaetaceae bacterium]|nr:hypothetical protein [Spirochaetaceae bacterium]
MEIGDWYREKTYNLKNGKEEWKYYHIKNINPENSMAEIDVYKIFYNGNISPPKQYASHIEVFEKCTKLSADYAYTVLKIKPPEKEEKI